MYSFSEEKEVQNGLFYHFIYKTLVVNWSNMLHRSLGKTHYPTTPVYKVCSILLALELLLFLAVGGYG